jgi:hypothetical protein
MRTLADLQCSRCGRGFYADLPAGHGLYYPMLLEKGTGKVHDLYGVPYFADWLRKSYAKRVNREIPFSAEHRKLIVHPVLLNCLDALYGHSLLKLLNAQYYLDHRPDLDLIVLIPRILRWLVPDGVAAVWTVDLPLARGMEWNDWLAGELHRRVMVWQECWLSVGFSHPHPDDYSIKRFTRVTPFPTDEWEERLSNRPTVTFVMRDDRVWDSRQSATRSRVLRTLIKHLVVRSKIERQRRRIIQLAEALRREFPKLDFAVTGLCESGRFPGWITDMRQKTPNDSTERAWCERYSCSHVVIGVHGSNMLLPSAHAGAVVDLTPFDRWGNILQDLLFRPGDLRETMFCCRILPLVASAGDVAIAVISLLKDHCGMLVNMRREFCDHSRVSDPSDWVKARQRCAHCH